MAASPPPDSSRCLLNAPMTIVATTGSIFFSTSSLSPVFAALLRATWRLTSLLPNRCPRIALPSLTVSACVNCAGCSR